MDRTGIVIEIDGQYSKIKLLRHTACGSCGACHLGDDQKDIKMVAKNDAGASVGDTVEVTMATDGVLGAAFIMYMIPLAALFIGFLVGDPLFSALSFGNPEVSSAILGIGLMAITFLIIKVNDKKFLESDKYTAHVTHIVTHNESRFEPLQINLTHE